MCDSVRDNRETPPSLIPDPGFSVLPPESDRGVLSAPEEMEIDFDKARRNDAIRPCATGESQNCLSFLASSVVAVESTEFIPSDKMRCFSHSSRKGNHSSRNGNCPGYSPPSAEGFSASPRCNLFRTSPTPRRRNASTCIRRWRPDPGIKLDEETAPALLGSGVTTWGDNWWKKSNEEADQG
jgi:hypothetical protein